MFHCEEWQIFFERDMMDFHQWFKMFNKLNALHDIKQQPFFGEIKNETYTDALTFQRKPYFLD